MSPPPDKSCLEFFQDKTDSGKISRAEFEHIREITNRGDPSLLSQSISPLAFQRPNPGKAPLSPGTL